MCLTPFLNNQWFRRYKLSKSVMVGPCRAVSTQKWVQEVITNIFCKGTMLQKFFVFEIFNCFVFPYTSTGALSLREVSLRSASSPHFARLRSQLGCPVFGSKFLIECSQAFSGANTWKNKICEVLALKVENSGTPGRLKFKKTRFFG